MNKFFVWFSRLLCSVAAVNWGLEKFVHWNLVDYLNVLSGNIGIDLFLYALISLAGIYAFIALFRP